MTPQPAANASRVSVTTSLADDPSRTTHAQRIASELGAPFVSRSRSTLPDLFATSPYIDRLIIVEGDGLALHHRDGTVYRYHPNMGFVRALNALRGHRDLFIEAAALTAGENVLDCTLGFAGEAMMSALIVGETGKVIGLESAPELAIVTREGLQTRHLVQDKLEAALRRIEVVNADYRDFLEAALPGAFDLICFDPFFHERLEGSEKSVDPLFRFGNSAPLDPASVIRATRIATRRVIVKHPKDAKLPEELRELRSGIVSARNRPVVYSLFDGLSQSF